VPLYIHQDHHVFSDTFALTAKKFNRQIMLFENTNKFVNKN